MAATVSEVAAILLVVIGYCHGQTQEEIVSSQCYGTVCWNQENYPSDEITSKLRAENVNNTDRFGVFQPHAEALRLEGDSCSLCRYKTSLRISPLTLKEDDNIYYIVNTENYQNNITLKICESDAIQMKGSKCMNLDGNLNYVTSCDQKDTTIKFLVYDKKNEKFTEKTWRYHSECVCTIKRIE